MYYTECKFAEFVVCLYRCIVKGWPPDIPFANFSSLPGGAGTLRRLRDLWESGELRLMRATDEDVLRAEQDPRSVFPNPVLLPRTSEPGPGAVVAPLTLHPADLTVLSVPSLSQSAPTQSRRQRCDIKKPRGRSGKAAEHGANLPVKRRRRRPGVLSPEYIWDSDVEESDPISKRPKLLLTDEFIANFSVPSSYVPSCSSGKRNF